MDSGITKTVKGIIILYLFVCSVDLNAQISNKYDIHIKYQRGTIVSRIDQTYLESTYGCTVPTILGNLNHIQGYEIGILYSKYSRFIQPGLIFSQVDYSGNNNLQGLRKDFHIRSYALGLECKFNLIAYGTWKVTPYFQVGTGYMLSQLTSKPGHFLHDLESINPDVLYKLALSSPTQKKVFINPVFEISFGTEIPLIGRVLIINELSVRLKDYPDFDIQSPLLVKELFLTMGIRYKLLKDKRYLLK